MTEEGDETGLFALTGTGQVIGGTESAAGVEEEHVSARGDSGDVLPPLDGISKQPDLVEDPLSQQVLPPPEVEDDPWNEFDIDPDNMSASLRPNAPRMRERYFGPDARAMFFQRLQFLSKQRNKINWEKTQDIDELIFDNEDEQKLDFPFAGSKGFSLEHDDYSLLSSRTGRADDMSTLTPDRSLHPGRRFRSGKSSVESKQESSESRATFRSAYADEFPDPGVDLALPLSPRTRFITGCIKEHRNPRASLILRKRLGKEINISHMAIGNSIALLLAQCLGDMPLIEVLNINNNNLTDEGVAAMLKAIVPIKTLKYLNISRNKMDDDAADALADYVTLEDCPVESLIMQVSDVDDFEGERFVRKLMENRSITMIDLSDNLIGRAENMRSVIPDLVTCTEAFADMLSQPNCILKTLILAWNTIRLQSAATLSRSLRANTSLTHLDISFNAFGQEGGEALGDALMDNTSIKYLNLASNGITASACFTISTGIIENQALHRVILDNNPIGEPGAQALMIVPITVGSRCKVTAEKCNVALSDPRCWFSHSNPLGLHHLDLSKPYERAVAFALCNLIANHSTYIFVSSTYEESKGGASRDLGLFQNTLKENTKFFDERQLSIIAGLEKMKAAAGNREKGIQLFREADIDGGGTIDAEELTALLEGVGMDVNEDMIEDIMMVYDVDNAGSIPMPEFLAFLKAQHKEASTRLEEMTEMRIMATKAEPDKKYLPPRHGILHLMVMDGFTRKEKYSVINTCDQDYAKQVSSSDSSLMLSFAVHNSKIRLGEAISMFNTMYNDGGQRAQILAKLVVKLANPADAKKLVMKVTKGDKTQINMLKNAMGGAYKPFLGIINGYYELDLKKEMDQIAMSRLLEQSQMDQTWRMACSPLSMAQIGDTSQCGTWTNFRNELLGNKRFAITPERFRPMPKTGRISFDFSSIARPVVNEDLLVMTDNRIVKILHNQFLIHEKDMGAAMKRMASWRRDLKRANTAKGNMLPRYEYDKEKGWGIGDACREFYENLESRADCMVLGAERENVKVDYRKKRRNKRRKKRRKAVLRDADAKRELKDAQEEAALQALLKEVGSVASGGIRGEVLSDKKVDKLIGPLDEVVTSAVNLVTSAATEKAKNDGGDGSVEGSVEGEENGDEEGEDDDDGDEEGSSDEYEDDDDEDSIAIEYMDFGGKKLTEDMAKHRMLLESPLISDEAKAVRIVELLEDTLGNCWIKARQMALIIESFPCGKSSRTDYFGTYHVQLIVDLFPRIVDIHNFEVIMKHLTAQECAQVYCRIGWLNIFNPCKPEGYWSLDFCRYEERLVAKMLIGLAVIEPGDNWQDQSFRWKDDMDPVPGWELSESYTKDATLTTKGRVKLKYYSGMGKNKDGCFPHVSFRRACMAMTLPSEQMHICDLDELFSHKNEEHSDDGEGELVDERDEADKAASGFVLPSQRELLQGEKYLKNNPTMWNELFAPPGGCVKQKNPLQLVFSSAVIDDDPEDVATPPPTADPKKKKK